MTPDQLWNAANRLLIAHPEVDLMKNHVGNLAVINPAGDFIGYVDMVTGEVHIYDEED